MDTLRRRRTQILFLALLIIPETWQRSVFPVVPRKENIKIVHQEKHIVEMNELNTIEIIPMTRIGLADREALFITPEQENHSAFLLNSTACIRAALGIG